MIPLAFAAFFVAVMLVCITLPSHKSLVGDEVAEMIARGDRLGHLPHEEAMRKARWWAQLGHYGSLVATAAILTLALWGVWSTTR